MQRASLLIGVLAISCICWYVGWHPNYSGAPAAKGGIPRMYATVFPESEAIILEHGNWINGKRVGVDWSDVTTTPGLVFGTDSGKHKYADSTALLAGYWGPDQTVEAVVHSVNPRGELYEEVELRLRSSLSPHRATGYEINFRCLKTAKAYAQIVRWNGRLGDFTYLKTAEGPRYGVSEGDIVRATVRGRTFTAYINGVEVLQAFDQTYSSGSPGLAFIWKAVRA